MVADCDTDDDEADAMEMIKTNFGQALAALWPHLECIVALLNICQNRDGEGDCYDKLWALKTKAHLYRSCLLSAVVYLLNLTNALTKATGVMM